MKTLRSSPTPLKQSILALGILTACQGGITHKELLQRMKFCTKVDFEKCLDGLYKHGFLQKCDKSFYITCKASQLLQQLQKTDQYLKDLEKLSGSKCDAKIKYIAIRTIQAIASTIEQRDPYTAGHQTRVAALAASIAKSMGLTAHQIEGIYLGGLVHDIGKIHIPIEILANPKILTEGELAIIKTHTFLGFEVLKNIPFEWPVKDIVLNHHEHLDGSGYPNGIDKEAVIIEVRIITVADVFEAMTAYRPYRPGRTRNQAIEELSTHVGKWYDKDAIEACVHIVKHRHFKFPKLNFTTGEFELGISQPFP